MDSFTLVVSVVIVKLGNWSKNKDIERICDELLAIEGTSRKSTPQRCVIKLKKNTLTSIGMDSGKIVMEFLPSKAKYAEAHGTSFVKPHPLAQMAREGWLMARTEDSEEIDQVMGWIISSVN